MWMIIAVVNLKKARELALKNIEQSQQKQKMFYDRQSGPLHYRVGDRVIVFMPSGETGPSLPWSLTNLTPTNAEVQLIERPQDQSIFVAIDRLRSCYPQLPKWSCTGRKGCNGRKKQPSQTKRPRVTGPVTRSMADIVSFVCIVYGIYHSRTSWALWGGGGKSLCYVIVQDVLPYRML